MAILHTITTALALCILTVSAPVAAAPTHSGTSSSEVSAELIEKQVAFWANRFVLDPLTNETIPNPAYPTEDSHLAKRNPFNPPGGAECRVSAQHYYYHKQTCSPNHGCEDDSYDVAELRIRDHNHPDTNFAVFNMENGQEQYFQLDNHRGWSGKASWTVFHMFGLESASGHIQERGGDRNMMGSEYCWYAEGNEWWGNWGEASCSMWCSDFKW